MAISKRLRFEILRRDKFKCQYCGLTAQETELHIDHVRPKSLGGDDGPENLVTACKDCNAGKSSISLDEPTVAQIAEDNAQAALEAQIRSAKMRGKHDELLETLEFFHWTWQKVSSGCGREAELPTGWRSSVINWSNMGVPLDEFEYAIEATMTRDSLRESERFRYLAGIIWGRIRDNSVTLDELIDPRIYTESEFEGHGIENWNLGWKAAEKSMKANPERIAYMHDVVAHFVDRYGPQKTIDLIWKEDGSGKRLWPDQNHHLAGR